MQLFDSKKMGHHFDFKVPWKSPSAIILLSRLILIPVSIGLLLPSQVNGGEPPSVKSNSTGATTTTTTSGGGTVVKSLPEPLHAQLISSSCPQLMPEVFVGYVPAGEYNVDRVNYNPVSLNNSTSNSSSIQECVSSCCALADDKKCQVAFLVNDAKTGNFSCYHVVCPSSDLDCIPKKGEVNGSIESMAMVRPRHDSKSNWHQILAANRSCEYGLSQCRPNEECVTQPGSKSRNGVCTCKGGSAKDQYGMCVGGGSADPEVTTRRASTPAPKKQLTVSIVSKNITLPENSAVLTAYAIPEKDDDGSDYSYVWTLVGNTLGDKDDKGTMDDADKQQLKLSNLKAGLYTFKVTVAGKHSGSTGESTGYVGVSPSARVNAAPMAVVKPKRQPISLPTNTAVIDASESKDDADPLKDLKFEWSLERVPIQYNKSNLDQSSKEATLKLKNLIAGNYTVKMTVTDKDGASNSTLAFVEVIEETDYPPTANAGEDKIVYLPQKTVELYGNGSSDDHGIVSYEWKIVSDDHLPVDIANSNKPILHLSNFEVGTYEFTLTVKDGKGQQASDSVSVYVKPPSNTPPVAVAKASSSEISLPVNWVTLDGSKSHDDVNVTAYKWEQISGSNKAVIFNAEEALANATGLTKGDYKFNLTVFDGAGNNNTASVGVIVKQDTNAAPVARAGPDFTVSLPTTQVLINGSGSSDDLAVKKWLWKREPSSLAAGKVVGESSKEPMLRLTDLVPGKYVFSLTVWDEQGKPSAPDTVTVTVDPDPNQLEVIEAVLDEPVSSLTLAKLDQFKTKIKLLLSSDDASEAAKAPQASGAVDTTTLDSPIHIKVIDVFQKPHSDNAVIKFVVEKESVGEDMKSKKAVMKGPSVVEELKEKLKLGRDVLKLQVVDLDTVVCQNDCSGHGKCQQSTRECICESFWIQNPVRRHLMDGKKNCEWSVVYVIIISSVATVGLIAIVVYQRCCRTGSGGGRVRGRPSGSSASKGRRDFRSSNGRASKSRYRKLEQTDPGMELRNAHTSSLMMSESDDTDSSDGTTSLFTDKELNINKAVSKKRQPFTRNSVVGSNGSAVRGRSDSTAVLIANGGSDNSLSRGQSSGSPTLRGGLLNRDSDRIA